MLCVCIRCQSIGCQAAEWLGWAKNAIATGNSPRGIIDAVGEGVSAERVGDRVWIYEATLAHPFGTAAEYVVVPSEHAVLLPDNTEFAAGACLGVPAMTAHNCVFKDGAVTGQTILVTGGAGAVGNYAIQLAKWGGAKVITTVDVYDNIPLSHKNQLCSANLFAIIGLHSMLRKLSF